MRRWEEAISAVQGARLVREVMITAVRLDRGEEVEGGVYVIGSGTLGMSECALHSTV